MNRVKVDSSSIREMGWDETGSEVQYHSSNCATARQGKPGSSKREAPHGGDLPPAGCNCEGGEVYHYPGVPKELHDAVLGSSSIGRAFSFQIKLAKHPETGGLLYPHVKRAKATE